MKEVTYEEWQKNPIPRMMWVWDDDISQKEKVKVVYIMKGDMNHLVIAVDKKQCCPLFYRHCAEIEEPEPKIR